MVLSKGSSRGTTGEQETKQRQKISIFFIAIEFCNLKTNSAEPCFYQNHIIFGRRESGSETNRAHFELQGVGILFAPLSRMIFFFLLAIYFCPQAEAQAHEPSIQEVQSEAIRYLGFDRQEIEGWKSKSRLSAVLPRFQVGLQRDLKNVVNLTTKNSVSITGNNVVVGPDKNNFDQNFNQGTSFEVKALWQLNELIFNRDSLAASNERRDWIRERSRTLLEVTEAYYTRKRLLKELNIKGEPPMIRDKKKDLLDQMGATLDAYTGGWFSQEMSR